jgi:hypothetical protein
MVLITFTCPQSPVPGCDENPRGFFWQILNALGVTGKHHLRTLFFPVFSLKTIYIIYSRQVTLPNNASMFYLAVQKRQGPNHN